MIIRPVELGDAAAFYDHTIRHFSESGEAGDAIFHPISDVKDWQRNEHIGEILASWERPLTELRWRRCWVIEENGEIVGDCGFQGSSLTYSLHRCTFSIGIERAWRGRGYGRGLSLMALAWAKQQSLLEWVDLYTFAHLAGPLALYDKLGFDRVGLLEDRFRILGQKIDEVQMKKALRPRA